MFTDQDILNEESYQRSLTENIDSWLQEMVRQVGKVGSIREVGTHLRFLDILGDYGKVQLMVKREIMSQMSDIKKGDIVGVVGSLGRGKKNDLLIIPSQIRNLDLD